VPAPRVVPADVGHEREFEIEAGPPRVTFDSRFSVDMMDSAMALSKAVPVLPLLGAMPTLFRRSVYS